MAFPNESGLDRWVRFGVGVLILGFGWSDLGEGLLGVACRIFGWYPLLTSLAGWSPLYAVLGWNTRKGKR